MFKFGEKKVNEYEDVCSVSRVLINCQLKNTTFEIVRCNDNIHQYWYYTLILKQKFYLAMYKIIDCSSITLSMIVLDPKSAPSMFRFNNKL